MRGVFNRFKLNYLNCISKLFGNMSSGVIVEKFDTSSSCTRTSRFVDFLDFSRAFVCVKSPLIGLLQGQVFELLTLCIKTYAVQNLLVSEVRTCLFGGSELFGATICSVAYAEFQKIYSKFHHQLQFHITSENHNPCILCAVSSR